MSSLPYDAQIEYLESDGTQYINTGFYPNQDTRVILDMYLLDIQNYAGGNGVWGCRTGNLVKQFYFMPIVNTNKSRWSFGNQSNETASNLNVSGRYIFDANKNVLNINGQITRTYTATANTFSCDYPFIISAVNWGGTISSAGSSRLYSCKIYDNGTLVRDYIPVRVGDVGYLYDKVSEQLFANAGTGDFVLGADIIEPSTNNMVEVEYLESTGTQIINTGISGGSNAEYGLTLKILTQSTNWTHICGSVRNEIGAPKIQRQRDTNNWIAEWYDGSVQNVQILTQDSNIHTVEYKDGKVYVDSVEKCSPSIMGFGNLDFCIFNYLAESLGGSIIQLYSAWVKLDGILVRNYIPVRVGKVGYLYDKVSGEFFCNDGAGEFFLGKDKALPNPFGFRRRLMIMKSNRHYITDGIVAWWDGIWNVGIDTPHSTSATSWADLSGGGRNMTLTQASWDNDSFVVLQSTQNKATIPSSFSYITCEIITKIDWKTNTQYNEAAVLSGIDGLGFYSQTHSQAYFSDNSGGGYNNKRFGFSYNVEGGILGIKNSVQYIVGGNTQDTLPSWKGFFNGEEKVMWYGAWGIGSSGRGINQRSDRRFAGNVYAIRMYNRMLDNTELRHNLIIDNQRFNLGLTL